MTRQDSYRRLIAWQKAMDLVERVYEVSASWPSDERFGLTSQVRRSAVSIPANIAEGSGRTGSAEMRHFLSIAHGSLCEVQTHLEIAQRLGFASPEVASTLLGETDEVGYVIKGFIRSLNDH